MSSRYVITTPIYYVNSVPHIGTALTTVAADVTARYQRMRGATPYFLTGTDENGTKVKEAAEEAGKTPQAFVDEMADRFASIWHGIDVQYDDFIRTTEPRHVKAVQALIELLQAKGHVYKGLYEGWYDVSSETYYKESDLIDGKSPDGNEVRWISEENYFFRLTAFEGPLLEHIGAHPEFIVPTGRRNEVISFINQGLRDVCMSRSNPGWGIPFPNDPSQVVYVWFDALVNYISAPGWPDPGWETGWPADVQWMGKDILTRFHATLWPAMLLGAGLPLPKTLVGHAWLLNSGEKISKSRGNVVAPLELAEELAERSGASIKLAVDAVRYGMCVAFPFESDATFSLEEFDRRYNADLANDLGNALNRSLAMSHKFVEGKVPAGSAEPEMSAAIEKSITAYERAMAGFRIDHALTAAWDLVRFLNKYIDTRAPWALAKTNDPALGQVLRSMILSLRTVEGLIKPVMPNTAQAISLQLGLPPIELFSEIGHESSLPGGTALSQPIPMFPRLDLAAPEVAPKVTKEKKAMPETTPPSPLTTEITIEDFAKVKLRVARIVEAEPLEDSDRLMKLQVLIGEEKRQIVAGIRKSYGAEELIGRQIVVCVNLKAAKLRGVESQGMLLAATDADGGAILLSPEKEAPEGANVK